MATLRKRRQKNGQESSEKAKDSQETQSVTTPPIEKSPTLSVQNRALDLIIVLVFTILAVLTRFYQLHLPAAVVFDELHFCKFIDRVIRHVWFFDIHPPLGKLILAYVSYAMGYRPDPSFVIEKIGNEYPEHVNYLLVRSVSAFFSVLTVPCNYLIARKLGISRVSNILCTSFVLFDFLGIIEGRLILMDSQLLFFCQLALLFALYLWETRRGTKERAVWLFLTGVTAGIALSIKHTALATPGLIAIISFFGLHFLSEPLWLLECIYAAVCGLTVYVTSFYIMFNALWHTGGKYDNFMPMHFKKTLIGGDHYDPNAKRANFWRLFLYLNRRMVQSNAGIKKRHTWESDWYQWIVNWRGVLYFVAREEKDGIKVKRKIYLLGNPVIIYATLACVVVFFVLLLLSVRYRNCHFIRSRYKDFMWKRNNGIFLLAGWLCNLLPYILVDRAAFIYHYMPGLFYGQLLTAVVVDFLPPKARMATVLAALVTTVAAFVYWSPWIYGFAITQEQHEARQWLPKWN